MSNELKEMIETIKKEIVEGGILYEVQDNMHVLSVVGAPWITVHAEDIDKVIEKMAEYALRPICENTLQERAIGCVTF